MRKVTAIDGLPVLNAKHPLTLHIIAADIAKASNKAPADCVVARAIRRDCRALEARVHLGRVYVKTNKDHWTRYLTPASMRDEIIAFDRGGTFEAGEFTLPAPQPSVRAVAGRRQGSNAGDRRPKHVKRAAPKRRPPTVSNIKTGKSWGQI